MFHDRGCGMSRKPPAPTKGSAPKPGAKGAQGKRNHRPAANNPAAVVAPAVQDTAQDIDTDGHADSMDAGHGHAPAACEKRPLPTLPDGSPDLEAVAAEVQAEIEAERALAWREALAADKRRELDHDRVAPPSGIALWQAAAPCPEEIPRPTLHEMHEHMNRNQLGDAELLRSRMAERMVYDHKRKRWMLYDGIRWVDDTVGESLSACMDVACLYDAAAAEQFAKIGEDVAQAEEAEARKWSEDPDSSEAKVAILTAAKAARKRNSTKVNDLQGRGKALRSLSRARQVLEVAASGAGSLGVSGEHWDAHPTLMACANGVVDFDTGALMQARPDLMLRKQSPYQYGGLHLHSDFWTDHLRKVFCGRAELIDYFERVIGYAATGLMSHKELYCAYGPTANNGKSQTFNAIADALGQYAGTFKVSVLLEEGQKAAGPDPDLLVLDGLRMAIASEPKRGAKFSAEMLKAVTGDDIIRARGLYSDPIEFRAICKLFLHTNFIPQLRSADKAFEKRLRVIPFEAVFTLNPDEVDEAKHVYLGLPSDVLKRRMEEAGPAILSWIVRCARRFLRERDLSPPPIVQQWTKEYAEEQDLVGEFIAHCCITGDGLKTQAKDIYAAFIRFCKEERGVTDKFLLSFRSFGEDMKQRVEKHVSNKVWYLGIAPRSEWTPEGGQGANDHFG